MISALPAFAQAGSEGSIVVTAMDSSGAVIPGAKLTLTALRTNDVRTAITANDGSHTFVNLAIGTYSLTIEKPEYDSREYSSVVVQASHVSAITATLPVGKSTQTIRVNSEAIPVMDTTSNAIGTVVDVKQIEDLPLSGRRHCGFCRNGPRIQRLGRQCNLQWPSFDRPGQQHQRHGQQHHPHEVRRQHVSRRLSPALRTSSR